MSITSANVSKYSVFIALTVTSIFWANTAIALQTNKNLLLSDGEDDSPQIILVDGDSKQLVLQKLDSGAATLLNEEGSICFSSDNDNDTDDTICFITNYNQRAIMWGGIDTLDPGIQVSNEGKLQYRNAAGTWIDFDTLSGQAITGTNIEDGTVKGVDIGSQSITSAHLSPEIGNNAQVLSLNNNGDLAWVDAGAAGIGDGQITSAKLGLGAVETAKINEKAVTSAKLAPNAVNSDKIIDGSIQAADIGSQSITSAKLSPDLGANGQVLSLAEGKLAWVDAGAAGIGDGQITSAKLGLGAVETANIHKLAVITDKLANDAVNSDKIINGTIVNEDINTSAAIVGTKIAPDFGAQLVTTTGDISGANITATGDVTVGNAKGLKLSDADGNNYMTLQAPNSVTSDTTLTLPASAGSDGQVLQTDGTGMLSWASAAADTSLATANQTLTANRTIELGSNTLTVTGEGANVTLPNASINTAELAADVVTPDKLANSAVTAAKLATGAVTSDAIADASIVAVDIAQDAIATAKLLDAAVTSAKLADSTIVNADINDSAAIAGTKIEPDFGAQLVTTTGNMRGANITATGDVTVDNAKSLKLAELDSNGSNTIALKAPNSVTSDMTLTLPSSAGSAGQFLQLDSIEGEISNLSWQTMNLNDIPYIQFNGEESQDSLIIGLDKPHKLFNAKKNVGIGVEVFSALKDGENNIALGFRSLEELQSGYGNVSIGNQALGANEAGSRNTAVGYLSLNNAKGNSNTAVGYNALKDINGSSNNNYNIAIGSNSGSNVHNSTGSIYIGSETKGFSNSENQNIYRSNEIVIGRDATGKGSNSIVLGNEYNENTYLRGQVKIDKATNSKNNNGLIVQGNVGIGGITNPNTALSVNGMITASGKPNVEATNGVTALTVHYNNGKDRIANFGSMNSTGAPFIAKGVESGAGTKYFSTVDLEDDTKFARGILEVNDSLIFKNAAETKVPKGDEVTMTERMKIDTDGNLSVAGDIKATGDVTVGKAKGLKLADDDGTYMILQAPNGLEEDTTLILPESAGSAGQVLQTNGNGTLSWANSATKTNLDPVMSSQGVRERGDCDMSNGGNDDYEVWVPIIKYSVANPGRNDGWEDHEYGFCVDKQHRLEGQVTWGEAYRYCARDNKRLLDYYQWRMACDGKFVDSPVFIPGILPLTTFTLAPGAEWASYPHPIHYIEYENDYDDSLKITKITKKTISGVGAVVGGLQVPEADAPPDIETNVNSCANLKTVKLRWTERIATKEANTEWIEKKKVKRNEENGEILEGPTTHPSYFVYNGRVNNQGPEKHYFRCAW